MNTRGRFFDHASAPCCVLDHGALAGLRHRTVIDRDVGASELALWQEEHAAGFLVPLHSHDCEEIITVLEGRILATIGDDRFDVGPLESVLIPARALHGFEVTSQRPVKLLAIFSSSAPRIFREGGEETVPPWRGGSTDHLQATTSKRAE